MPVQWAQGNLGICRDGMGSMGSLAGVCKVSFEVLPKSV